MLLIQSVTPQIAKGELKFIPEITADSTQETGPSFVFTETSKPH
jgi:hypothetical protein